MSMLKRNTIYETCDKIIKKKPEYHIDQKLADEIASDYRTLPTFERCLFERIFVQHYSLQRNESLKSCWKAYRDNIESRVFAPFQFPHVKDLHFHNNTVRFLPELSRHNIVNNRKKLKIGPGVDYGGQMPIPQEILMRRSGDSIDRRKKNILKKSKKQTDLTATENKKVKVPIKKRLP